MATFYRNRETGKVQSHPKSGIGESLNADEIGEDGKPVKPRTSLAPTTAELKAAKALLKGHASPLETAANQAVLDRVAAEKAKANKTTDASPGSGDSNKPEGDQ